MGKNLHIMILVFSLCFVCTAQEDSAPEGWVVLDSLYGNLNNDHADEKVLVYSTTDSVDFGRYREIRIFKKDKGNWALWESSRSAMLKSDDGGMMGDPYGGIEIKNKVLLIHHNGGSSWKWGYTDKYRFQNGRFELIGYTSLNGKPCFEWSKIDFNISTGKINYAYEDENCDSDGQVAIEKKEETFYKKGIQLTFKNRRLNEIELISPKLKFEFHL